ncbi:MAG: hypothetical protein HQL93_14140 [Magnetococcales bacterium]|nr:hypothetical protein [Magnetococcales bacterium]
MPSPTPTIRPVQPDDYEAIAFHLGNYRAQQRKNEYWLNRFVFWWELNPFHPHSLNRGWILEDGGLIRGFLGCIGLPYQWNYQPCPAMTPTAWSVDPNYRHHALKLFAAQLEEAKKALLLDTTPTHPVRQIAMRCGFTPIPYDYDQHVLIFHDYAGFQEWHLRSKGRDSWWPARIRRIENLFRCPPPSPSTHHVRQITDSQDVGDAFDKLWERTRRVQGETRMRSASWVRWYCFGFADQPKSLFACYLGKQLLAYAIFRPAIKRAETKEALPVLFSECLDFWHDPDYPKSIDLLMNHALHQSRLDKQSGLATFVYPPLKAWVERQNRIIPTAGTPAGLFLQPPHLDSVHGTAKPYFLLAEGDVGL